MFPVYDPRFSPLNAEINPIRHLLALVGARHIVHVSRVRVKVTSLAARRQLTPRSNCDIPSVTILICFIFEFLSDKLDR